MLILAENRARGKVVILSKRDQLEADGGGLYEIKIVSFHRFRTLEAVKDYIRNNGLKLDISQAYAADK